ncbi:MAG: efflux RND transporter periplasmic adaptor subunit [Sphaerotilus natans subsp. sulfidivorans]|uniref:efflux RND transporter periplasmic adaptor subunit n=1 Tax=Sphaerotilus sulfidivorans TaxID=639200 RepID=UPI002352030B|nr:efflux RND transporter periplasmic adaptor subunit [Sphaerotilus sulfidivorans]MCK6401521.1 efflux RND transporter periplasmic adaptor subunit [Sphaerotilus sulfidivorans]
MSSHHFHARSAVTLAAGLLAALALTACGGGDKAAGAAPGPGAGAAPPPPAVGVLTVKAEPVAIDTELSGRLEAWRTAQVRARVAGVVGKRLFTEGSEVKAGQALFQIDDAPYRAALDSALAAQARAEANLAQAQANLARNEPLAAAKAISQTEWVATQTALKQAQAEVATAKAAVTTARLNVDYAQVRAPISGTIGRALVTEGALVGQGEVTQLALIQQTDPMYVNFTQSAAEVLRLRRAVEAGQLGQGGGRGAEVRLVLDDGSEHPQPGRLLFSDLSVDATSGQVTLRAEVPNPKGTLLPGLFVRVRTAQAEAPRAMLLPQQAVTRGSAGDTVLVVGEGNLPAPRPVKIGGSRGASWVVLDGLKEGERVIVDGFQKMRPKSPVTPVPWVAAPAMPMSPASAASR